MLQPEHEFCQHSGPECGQVQDWYLNEKMMLVHACLNEHLVLQCLEVIHRINKDERDEFLAPYSFFRRCCQCNFSKIFKGR